MIVNVIDYGLNIAEATYAPRIHQPWRAAELAVEPGISNDTLALLRARGHVLVNQDTMGSSQSIALRDGRYFGAADSHVRSLPVCSAWGTSSCQAMSWVTELGQSETTPAGAAVLVFLDMPQLLLCIGARFCSTSSATERIC